MDGREASGRKTTSPLQILIRRTYRYVYLLKLSDNSYYAGQTSDNTYDLNCAS